MCLLHKDDTYHNIHNRLITWICQTICYQFYYNLGVICHTSVSAQISARNKLSIFTTPMCPNLLCSHYQYINLSVYIDIHVNDWMCKYIPYIIQTYTPSLTVTLSLHCYTSTITLVCTIFHLRPYTYSPICMLIFPYLDNVGALHIACYYSLLWVYLSLSPSLLSCFLLSTKFIQHLCKLTRWMYSV